jgi:hypothetical protein
LKPLDKQFDTDLRVYHETLSVLPAQQAGLAELDSTQPELERLLHQAAQGQEKGWERLLLDFGAFCGGHV